MKPLGNAEEWYKVQEGVEKHLEVSAPSKAGDVKSVLPSCDVPCRVGH